MLDLLQPWLPMGFAFVLSALFSLVVREAGVLDHPNARSSHSNPTPRGGGVGILAGFAAALAVQSVELPHLSAVLVALLVLSTLAGGVGLLDDLFTLSEKLKFMALVSISLAVAFTAGPVTELAWQVPWVIGLLGSALFVFTTVNAINFMDGSDGLMVAALVPATLALAGMGDGDFAAICILLALAQLGFALLNALIFDSRGSLFSGDAGSLGVAVLVCGLALWWASTGPSGSVWLVPLILLPLLGDVLLTMASRARAGRRLFSPHRAHAYQLLIRLGWSHGRVALIWVALSTIAALLAWLVHEQSALVKFVTFGGGVIAFTTFHQAVRRHVRSRGLDTTQ